MNLEIIIRVFFLVSLVAVKAYDNDVVKMIVSFLIYNERPTYLLAPHLCWEKHKTKILVRSLYAEGVGTAYSLQQYRTEHYLQHIVVLADLNCPGIPAFLMKASEEGYLKSPYRWLFLGSNQTSNILEAIDVLVDSDVIIANTLSSQEIILTEAYKISEKSNVIYTKRLLWRDKDSKNQIGDLKTPDDRNTNQVTNLEQITDLQNLYKSIEKHGDGPKSIFITKYGVIEDYQQTKVLSARRNNLRRHILTMANVITDSNETRKHMDDRLNLHQDSITKMSYGVIKVCFEMLNATEKLIFTHTWGYRDKNGNWQGIVDHLIKKEADLGTLTIFTQERMNAVDYIAMVGSTAVRFVFREPPLAYVANIFTMPFNADVWLAILICVTGCAVFLYFTSKWEASMSMHPLQLDGSWADVLILTIGAVLQQGCTQEPRYAAGRCVTLILFVALTIVYAAYSANIVVLLRAPSSSVRSLPDLLNSPLKVGASDFEYNRYFFKKLNDPIRKAIYDKKIAPKGKKPNFYSMEEGVEKVRKGLFAFHMELNPGYRLIQETYQEDEKCDLVEIDYINEIDPWVPGQKRSPFKDLFKISLLKIRERGVQVCLYKRLQVSRPKCSGQVATFSSVGIRDMAPAMLATLYGVLLAPAVLALEIAYKQWITARERRKSLSEKQHRIPYLN